MNMELSKPTEDCDLPRQAKREMRAYLDRYREVVHRVYLTVVDGGPPCEGGFALVVEFVNVAPVAADVQHVMESIFKDTQRWIGARTLRGVLPLKNLDAAVPATETPRLIAACECIYDNDFPGLNPEELRTPQL